MTIASNIEQLINLFESIQQAIVIVGENNDVIFVNDHFLDFSKEHNFDDRIIIELIDKHKSKVLENKCIAYNQFVNDNKIKLTIEIKLYEQDIENYFVVIISVDDLLNNFLGRTKNTFKLFAESAPYTKYVCLNDSDWTMLFINKRIEDLTGYSPDDFMNSKISLNDLFYNTDKENIYQKVQESIKKDRSFHLRYQLRHKNGAIKWVEEYGSAVYDGDRLLFLQGFIIDITETKDIISQSKDKENLYFRLFNNSYTMMCVIDMKTTNFIDINDALAKHYGYKREELKGKSLAKIHTKTKEQLLKDFDNFYSNTDSGVIQTKHKTRSGKIIDIEVYTSNINIAGKEAIFSIMTDITDRKNITEELKSEKERLELFLDATNDGVWEFDVAKDKVVANNRYFEMIGYDYDLNMIKPEYRIKYVHPDDKEKYLNIIDNALKNKDFKDFEYRVQHKDGHYIWVQSIGNVKTDAKGDIIRVTGVIKDVTKYKREEQHAKNLALLYSNKNNELKNINKELEIQKDRAEQSDKLKTSFLALLSHELRTPLNSINGFSSLIATETDLTDIHTYADIINKSGMHLLEIINDLIDISNIEIKEVDVDITKFKVNEIYDEIKNYIDSILLNNLSFAEKKLDIQHKKCKNIDEIMIETDKGKLIKILKTIINNAIKFTHEGKVTYGCQLFANHIEFIVEDEGIGIEDKQLQSIFDAFTQSEDYLNRQHGGLGIGLSIAKSYIKLLKGYVLIDSKKDVGTKITIRLPRFNNNILL